VNAIPQIVIVAVAIQRLVELAWSRRNTKRLIALGATEIGADHYPFIVLMHTAWLVTMLVLLPPGGAISPVPFALFLALQLVRLWVLATLGSFFTTRIISLPNAPLVRSGPYRFIRHPNYLVVAGEVALLPLALGEPGVAIGFFILNAAMLSWRIRVEERALAPRRARAA
jgi:methyltransferase